MTEDPREFFLVIESLNLDWSVSVDEGFRDKSPAVCPLKDVRIGRILPGSYTYSQLSVPMGLS